MTTHQIHRQVRDCTSTPLAPHPAPSGHGVSRDVARRPNARNLVARQLGAVARRCGTRCGGGKGTNRAIQKRNGAAGLGASFPVPLTRFLGQITQAQYGAELFADPEPKRHVEFRDTLNEKHGRTRHDTGRNGTGYRTSGQLRCCDYPRLHLAKSEPLSEVSGFRGMVSGCI